MPAHVIKECKGYVAPLTGELYTVAQKAARDLEIVEPVFFFQSSKTSHACASQFNVVGFNIHQLSAYGAHSPDAYQRLGFENAEDYNIDILRCVYHELCHIKAGHTGTNDFLNLFHAKMNALRLHTNFLWDYQSNRRTRRCILPCPNGDSGACEQCQEIEAFSFVPDDAPSLYARFQEMEAELGAIYFLWRLHGIDAHYQNYVIDDGKHPTREDQNRYNELLFKQLDLYPELDYSVVQKLAREYLLEKNLWFGFLFID